MHNAAFQALGLDWAYLPFHVIPEYLPSAVKAIRALELAGVNVTMPHKEAVIPYLDFVHPEAALTRSVNTIVNRDGRLEGFSTDGDGFLLSLADNDFKVDGAAAAIFGAGGAARAVAAALAKAGAARVDCVARNADSASDISVIVVNTNPASASTSYSLDEQAIKAVKGADLFVNATPSADNILNDSLRFLVDALSPGSLAVDLGTVPPLSAFLVAAQLRGCTVVNGRGMLVHQGSISFTKWTGVPAPVEVMKRAVGEKR
jgi:shikimate dehydrogenase